MTPPPSRILTPEQRAAVTSRGGTPEAALQVLQQGGIDDLVARALQAGAARSVQLGDMLSGAPAVSVPASQ